MHCFPFSLVQNGYHLIDPANKHPAWNICRLEKGTKHPNDKTYEGFLREVFLWRKFYLHFPAIRLNRTFLGRFSDMSGWVCLAKSLAWATSAQLRVATIQTMIYQTRLTYCGRLLKCLTRIK